MNYLLDTNVVSEWIKPKPDANVIRWLAQADEDRIYLSVITLAEISNGVEELPESPRRATLTSWLENDLPSRFEGRVLNVDQPAARAWGVVMAASRRAGHARNPVDAFFAATALVNELTLVTRNTRHFAPLRIELLNPWLAQP